MFLWILRVCSARVASYKEACATSFSNRNSPLVRIVTTCLLIFFPHDRSLAHTFGVILWILSLVMVYFFMKLGFPHA